MNRIFSWVYRFRLIRLALWRLKKWRNYAFNDREEIQERIDLGFQLIPLPNRILLTDHTINIGTGTTLLGSYHPSKQEVVE